MNPIKFFIKKIGKMFLGETKVNNFTSNSIDESPELDVMIAELTEVGVPAKVIVYNDEIHTFDEVISQLLKAVSCNHNQAEKFALEIDTRGLACVFQGEVNECLRVTSILEEIALHTSIEL